MMKPFTHAERYAVVRVTKKRNQCHFRVLYENRDDAAKEANRLREICESEGKSSLFFVVEIQLVTARKIKIAAPA